MKKQRAVIFAGISIILIALIVWTAWGNTALELNKHTVASSKLPGKFDGWRIAHISDLHNAKIGDDNEKLLAILHDAEPDIIAITGDMIDSRRTDIRIALDFAEKAVQIAPCYYVTGNHESRIDEYIQLKKGLEAIGVVVLENERKEITVSADNILDDFVADEHITLIGLEDPAFSNDFLPGNDAAVVQNNLEELVSEDDEFTILLSHRPELFDVYAEYKMNVILCGHAHGGQIRLPFVGGIIAPNQGFFPEYDSGLYSEEDTNMLVSRGIGNSLFPFRFNNRPEVILVELRAI